jgi:DNA modification methylase
MGAKNGSEYRRLTNVWYDISPVAPMSKEYNGYPCQKPIALMERIITVFSNKGDTVLDFFCGSGTTGIACQNLNRKFILADNSEEAINLSLERINKKLT